MGLHVFPIPIPPPPSLSASFLKGKKSQQTISSHTEWQQNSRCAIPLNHNSKEVFLSASLIAQMVKNLPAMQETRTQSLGQEDPLEKAMTVKQISVLFL